VCGAFTLVELMVSMGILAILMLVIATTLGQVQGVWVGTRDRVETYREARRGFELMSERLTQATLNSYWGYERNAAGQPARYVRHSDLHFVTGPAVELLAGDDWVVGHAAFFQGVFGYAGREAGEPAERDHLSGLVNEWGYYVRYDSDLEAPSDRPSFLGEDLARYPERRRFRLMEFRRPAGQLSLYQIDPASTLERPRVDGYGSQQSLYRWFGDEGVRRGSSWPVAENIIACVVSPRAPAFTGMANDHDLAPNYLYDTRRYQWAAGHSLSGRSRHQLPPTMELSLVAVTEASWLRFEERWGEAGASELRDLINGLFRDVVSYEDDLEELGEHLREVGLEHRVFHAVVALRAAKWFTDVEVQ